MNMEKKWWIPYIIAVICLLAGTFFDYQISTYLYHPENLFGVIFERYILCFFIACLCFVFAMLQRLHDSVLYLIPEVIAAGYAVVEVGKYLLPLQRHLPFIILASLGILALCNLIVYRLPIGTLKNMEKKGIFYACVLITAIAVTFLIKNLWGRIRFRDLSAASQFTSWYLPQGYTGHFSFPSGHTTSVSAILSLLVISKRCEEQKPPLLIVIFVYGMIICMALSRMIMGAHYLSDTATGFLIAYTVFLLYRKYFYRKRYL